MSKKIIFVLIPLTLIGLVFVGLNGCNNKGSEDPWSTFNVFDNAKLAKNVELYYDATLGYESDENAVFDVYTEMSMDFGYMAYQMPQNKEFAGDVFFELGKIHHYLIEQNKVVDGGILTGKDDILNKLIEPSVYKSTGVDIEKGMKQLVENNRPALLITDFEQWDQTKGKELYDQAIYNNHFKEWLSRPNHTITFYFSDFCDAATDKKGRTGKGKDIMLDRFHKKLFFAFFDVDKDRTLTKRAIPATGAPQSFDSIVIDIAPYKLSNNYGSVNKSGLAMGLQNQVTEVLQGITKNKNFEFINVGKYNWEYIDKTIQQKKNDPFFEKLFLDASNNIAFDLQSLSVEVHDVTDDFTNFVRCNYAKTLKPKIIQDKNGGNIFDPKSDPISKVVFDVKSGELKKEWIYNSGSIKSESFSEFFDMNNLLFKNDKKRTKGKQIHVQVMMHNAYNLAKMTTKDGLLRVDVIAKDVKKNYGYFDLLTWDSPSNTGGDIKYANTSLTKSIQSALKELQGGQIIYSYYLRVLPNKE